MGQYQKNVNKWKAELTSDTPLADYKDGEVFQELDAIWTLATAESQVLDDPTRKTARDILADVGVEEFDIIMPAFEAAATSSPGLAVALEALQDYGENGGLDFSASATINVIDSLGAANAEVFTEARIAALKSLGKESVTILQKLGIEAKKYHLKHALQELTE